jgi:hypothetical protein
MFSMKQEQVLTTENDTGATGKQVRESTHRELTSGELEHVSGGGAICEYVLMTGTMVAQPTTNGRRGTGGRIGP